MHFGSDEIDIQQLDFTLPADTAMTSAVLEATKGVNKFEAHVGAPKWGYKHWLGKLYPKGTKDTDFLIEYAMHFNTVELNATFYGLQPADRMAAWRQMVKQSSDFRFCPKFPQSISHIRRFRNTDDITKEFYKSVSAFGNHLGPLYLQLADNFTPKTFHDLKTYLMELPKEIPLFVEARNKNWFAEPEYRDSLFNLLMELGIGSVISDTAGRRDCVHMELTTPHAFIRFVNSRDEGTDLKRLDEWVKRLKSWKEQGLKSLWFFIHAGDTPALMFFEHFIPKLNSALGISVQLPKQLNS